MSTNGNAFENTVLLSLDVHKVGDRKTVKADVVDESVKVESDKTLLKLSKKVLDCPEYEDVKAVVTQARAYLKARALPAKFIKGGIYPLPLEFVEAAQAKMEEFQSQFNAAVEKFIGVYAQRIAEVDARLQVLANGSDHPSEDAVRQACWFRWEYVTMGPPGSLQKISADIWAKEKAKAEVKMSEAADEVRQAMREGFAALVQHMKDKLAPSEDGKRKVLFGSTVDKFKEFLKDFSAKNITGDTDLESLVGKARDLLSGVKVENLRKDDDIRVLVKTEMEAISTAMNSMLKDSPSRKIDILE